MNQHLAHIQADPILAITADDTQTPSLPNIGEDLQNTELNQDTVDQLLEIAEEMGGIYHAVIPELGILTVSSLSETYAISFKPVVGNDSYMFFSSDDELISSENSNDVVEVIQLLSLEDLKAPVINNPEPPLLNIGSDILESPTFFGRLILEKASFSGGTVEDLIKTLDTFQHIDSEQFSVEYLNNVRDVLLERYEEIDLGARDLYEIAIYPIKSNTLKNADPKTSSDLTELYREVTGDDFVSVIVTPDIKEGAIQVGDGTVVISSKFYDYVMEETNNSEVAELVFSDILRHEYSHYESSDSLRTLKLNHARQSLLSEAKDNMSESEFTAYSIAIELLQRSEDRFREASADGDGMNEVTLSIVRGFYGSLSNSPGERVIPADGNNVYGGLFLEYPPTSTRIKQDR